MLPEIRDILADLRQDLHVYFITGQVSLSHQTSSKPQWKHQANRPQKCKALTFIDWKPCQNSKMIVSAQRASWHAGEARAHAPTTDLHELMAQVAAGLIAPEIAAYQVVRQVGEDLGTSNVQQQSTAEQLIHHLASPADVLREQESGSGGHLAEDVAQRVRITCHVTANQTLNSACPVM